MEIDRNGLEVLGRDDCLRLLAAHTFGRVGVTIGALPSVLPVNYRLIGDRIAFRTGAGSKLAAAASHAVVAFEVDDMDPVTHTGWSVVVTGMAAPASPSQLAEVELNPIPHWVPGSDRHVVVVGTDLVSGRRIVPGVTARRPASAQVRGTRHTAELPS